MAGLFHGDFFEQGLELRIVGLLGQRQVALPGLQLVGDGQFDGLYDVQFGFGLVLGWGWFGCHIFLGPAVARSACCGSGLGNYITIFGGGKDKLSLDLNLFRGNR
jgi:hypothetical protein